MAILSQAELTLIVRKVQRLDGSDPNVVTDNCLIIGKVEGKGRVQFLKPNV